MSQRGGAGAAYIGITSRIRRPEAPYQQPQLVQAQFGAEQVQRRRDARALGIDQPRCGWSERCGHHGAVPSSTLAGQVAVVTGASRGIGRQVALHLAERGAAVAAIARASAALTGLPEEAAPAGGRLRTFAADVTAPAEVEDAFAAVDADLGAVTLAVACAGTGTRRNAGWNRVGCHNVCDRVGARFLAVLTAVAVLAVAGCGSATGSPAEDGDVEEPPLVGTEWQLASYQDPAADGPVTVKTDSTLSFSAKGRFSAHACNYLGGTAQVDPDTITFGQATTTDIACTGEPGMLNERVAATVRGSVGWSIRAGMLTLTGAGGHLLSYRVRPSIYPSLTARTILAGDRDGGQWRLAVAGPTDRPFLVFEERTAPGESWGTAGVMSPGPRDCLANSVMPGAGSLGGQTFVAAWATPEVAKVTTRATEDAPETTLTFYPVPGSTLRIAGLWIEGFRPSSPVTFYDRTGAVIAASPNGPC